MSFTLKQEGKFKFIDEGEGEPLLLLHGLFGALSNWDGVIKHFSKNYRVIIPMIPIYTINITQATIKGLTRYVERFIQFKELKNFTLIGNSLRWASWACLYLKKPKQCKTTCLNR